MPSFLPNSYTLIANLFVQKADESSVDMREQPLYEEADVVQLSVYDNVDAVAPTDNGHIEKASVFDRVSEGETQSPANRKALVEEHGTKVAVNGVLYELATQVRSGSSVCMFILSMLCVVGQASESLFSSTTLIS